MPGVHGSRVAARSAVLVLALVATLVVLQPSPSAATKTQGGTRPVAIELVRAEVVDTSSWMASLGGSPRRALMVTLRNDSDIAIVGARLTVAVSGRGSPDHLVPTTRLAPIGPGEEATVRVPFDLGAFAVGDYTVTGTVAGGLQPVTFAITTSAYPWMLLGVALLLVVLVAATRVMSARRGGRPVRLPPAELTAGTPPVDAAVVADQTAPPVAAGDRPPPRGTSDQGQGGPSIASLEAVVVEELGRAMDDALAGRPLAGRSEEELAALAGRVAFAATRGTAQRHPLGRADAKRLLVAIFEELTEQLGIAGAVASGSVLADLRDRDPSTTIGATR
jgi:hypothetical protein